jgi:hypothetical protein
MIDWTALATFALAAVTAVLAWQVREQIRAAGEADVARQREVHILAVEPLIVPEPEPGSTRAGSPVAGVRIEVPTRSPVLDLTVAIRGETRDPQRDSTSVSRGSLPTGATELVTLDILPFVDLANGRTWGTTVEVEVSYHGLLGQWVVEHYEWSLTRAMGGDMERLWRLYRLEIAPNVPGAAAIDQWFGERPPFHPEFLR